MECGQQYNDSNYLKEHIQSKHEGIRHAYNECGNKKYRLSFMSYAGIE